MPSAAGAARDWDSSRRFVAASLVGLAALCAVAVLFLVFGADVIELPRVAKALLAIDESDFGQIAVRDIRLPRLIADLMVGTSLAVAGAIMQGTTKNPMADSGIMGISAGSTLGVVVVMTYLPWAGRYERMAVSALAAACVTLLIYAIAYAGRGRITTERMVLSGMAISTLLSSVTSAVILKNGMMNQMVRYTSGSSANTVWKDLAVAAPFFVGAVVVAVCIARSLTVMNLGEEVSAGLGANNRVVRAAATLVVLVLSAVTVIIIGPVSYVGLMIPYIARFLVGTDYRYVLPVCAIYGGLFVSAVDLLAKTIHPGMEFPIGLLITMVGVPFFIYVSRKQGEDPYGSA